MSTLARKVTRIRVSRFSGPCDFADITEAIRKRCYLLFDEESSED